jgi:hypothetical protein
MGLKVYRLWDMGQLDSTCRAPPRTRTLVRPGPARPKPSNHPHRRLPRAVAPQVAFEKQTLKPGFRLIGDRLWV